MISEAQTQIDQARLMELRELVAQLNLTQRGLSRVLELDPDDIRHMCSGHRFVPLVVLYAARYLRTHSASVATDCLTCPTDNPAHCAIERELHTPECYCWCHRNHHGKDNRAHTRG